MARRAGPMILPLFLTAALGGFVWCTHHPGHPWIAAAQEWPVVGEWVGQFRTAYLGAAAGSSADDAEGQAEGDRADETTPDSSAPVRIAATTEVRRDSGTEPRRRAALAEQSLEVAEEEDSEPRVVGGLQWVPERPPAVEEPRRTVPRPPPAIDTIDYIALEQRWFLPGQKLYSSPSLDAEVDEPLDAMAYLPVISRDGVWNQVVLADQKRWIDTSWQPPYSRKKARRGILRHRYNPVQSNSYRRLDPVRDLLGLERPNRKLGAYNLWTDVSDEELLSFLDSAALAAEEAYFARYGRLPSGNPQRSVALFRERETYEKYAEAFGVRPGGTAGHASQGVAAFYAGRGSRRNLTRTLVHEICHLLNKRALGWDLPTWLEEGMASDLGALWIEKDLGSTSDSYGTDLFSQGHVSRLFYLESLVEKGELHSLAVLLNLDRKTFYRPDVVTFAYAYSAVFITFLLDDDGPRADGFRKFLHRIAVGKRADLFEILGQEGPEVEQELLAWLRAEVAENRRDLDRIDRRYRGL